MAKTEKTADKEPVEAIDGAKTTGEGASSLDDAEYLKKWILDCKKEAEDATAERREQWKELWDVYKNKQKSHEDKDPWQSQACIPKLFMAVERASLLIERATLQTSKLFSIELDDEFVLPLKSEIRQARKDVVVAQREAEEAAQNTQQVIRQIDEETAELNKKIGEHVSKIEKQPVEYQQRRVAAAAELAIENQKAQHRAVIDLQTEKVEKANERLQTAKDKLQQLEDQLDEYEQQCQEDDARFKAHLKKSNFVSAYGEMTKPACLLGLGSLKRLIQDGRLKYENKDVQNLFIAPEYLPFDDQPPRYMIEYKEMDLASLIKMAKKQNRELADADKNAKPVFDMEEINKIHDDYQDRQERKERLERLGLSEYTSVSKKVGILEFWGRVISKDGKETKENQLMMLANEKYLIRSQDNPHKSGKHPYELAIPMPYAHRGAAGISMVEAEVKLQYTLNNLLNLFVDNLTYSVNTMLEYDPQKLLEPQNMTWIFPGKLIKTKPGIAGPVVNQVKTQPMGADAFRVFEIVTKELQEGSAITEFLTAMPGKQSKTLGEIEIKTAESHGYFDVIARRLEINSIAKLLYNSYEMLQQYKGDQFKNLERYQFNVGGLSLLLLEKQMVEYLIQALGLALKHPQISQWTDVKDLWQRLLSIWNLDEAHREEAPEQQMMLPQAAQQPVLPAPQGA